jgi:hypothetical protein
MKSLVSIEYKLLSLMNKESISRFNHFWKRISKLKKDGEKKEETKEGLINYLFLNELHRRHIDVVLLISALVLIFLGLNNFFIDYKFHPLNISLISTGFFLEYLDLLIKFPTFK